MERPTTTALQLATALAEAARSPAEGRSPAEAILDTLDRCGCWFCRLQEATTGPTEEILLADAPRPARAAPRPQTAAEAEPEAPLFDGLE